MSKGISTNLKDLLQTKDPSIQFHWNQICEEAEVKERAWIADLRAKGVAAAHPDDGWVNRESSEVCFCYPQFRDNITEGSLVMLGDSHSPERNRLVRVLGRRATLLGLVWWKFEEVCGSRMDGPCLTCTNYTTKMCDTCIHNIPKLLMEPTADKLLKREEQPKAPSIFKQTD